MMKKSLKPHLKTILAIIWFVFTFSLVTWWWVFFLLRKNEVQTSHRMFAWEGSILLAAILLGGISLIVFTYRDQQRHQRLRFFFATFSHDIKTSIARLRLQAEVLEEDLTGTTHPIMKRLISDIQRLDLQLENSLLLATLENGAMLSEDVSLNDLLSSLRNEFPELTLELNKEALLRGDRRALLSIFKNLLQNSVLHGKATTVRLNVTDLGHKQVQVRIQDNGLGFKGDIEKLGSEILISQNTQSNGIGLLITTRLLQKMGGQIHFESKENTGFCSVIKIKGQIK